LWEEQVFLYDYLHEDYRDADRRKEALDEIAEEMGLTGKYEIK
jgi:hypothetical protein